MANGTHSDTVAEVVVISSTSAKKRKRGLKKRLILVLRIVWFTFLYLLWPLFRRILKPAVVFFVYPGKPSDKYAYFTPWMERHFRAVFPLGVLKFNGRWGIVGAKPITTAEMDVKSSLALTTMDQIQKEFPLAVTVALAGRFPGYVHRAHGKFLPPFVEGTTGTVFAMISAAKALARKKSMPPSVLNIAVLGGAGVVGSQLVDYLGQIFGSVIAFDPRYTDEKMSKRTLFTSQPERLCEADVAIVLTAEGDQVAKLAPYFTEGTVIADDTHPCMYKATRDEFTTRGCDLWKVTMEGDLLMIPRLPNFEPSDIPGCLVEAITVAIAGWGALDTQHAFNEAAANIGFKTKLYRHPDED